MEFPEELFFNQKCGIRKIPVCGEMPQKRCAAIEEMELISASRFFASSNLNTRILLVPAPPPWVVGNIPSDPLQILLVSDDVIMELRKPLEVLIPVSPRPRGHRPLERPNDDRERALRRGDPSG
jgi:hypothetical protein